MSQVDELIALGETSSQLVREIADIFREYVEEMGRI